MTEENSRRADFMKRQERYGVGTRMYHRDLHKEGFILEWNVSRDGLSGKIGIIYDDGEYQQYDTFALRSLSKLIDSKESPLFQNRGVIEDAYRRFCESLFLSHAA